MRLLFSLLLLLSFGHAAAQDFHRYYDLAGSDDLRDLVVLASDRLVGIGISRPEDGPESTSLLIMDGAGEVLSTKTLDFPTRTRGMALARQTDSTFWMGVWQTPVGIIDDWAVYRVNAITGTVINGFGWGEPNTDEQIRAMAPTPDGGVVVVGNTGDENEAIISRLAADGTEIFRRGFSMPGNRFTIFTDVAVLPGGDILAAGGFRPNDDDELASGYVLARIGPTGNLVWSRRYDLNGGLGADGAGLSLDLLDQGLVALVGTGVVNDDRHAIMLLVNANGGVETAFRGEAGTRARGVLSVAGQSLRIAGTASVEGGFTAGMVVSLDLAGNLTPTTTLVTDINGSNSFRGIRRRPGGGFYLIGDGRLCPMDGDRDALLISIGEDLKDEVANCETTDFSTRGLEFSVGVSTAGELFTRNDQRFAPANFAARSATTRDQICPQLDVTFPNLPDPLCYREPVDLIETALSLLPEDRLTQIRVSLSGADGGEFLTFDAPASGVTITDNSLGTNFVFEVNGPGGGAGIMNLLRSLRYAAGAGVAAEGSRTLNFRASGECVSGPIVSFDFNVLLDGNPLAGLPTDTILCPGNDLLLSVPASSAAAISWSTGAATPDLVITDPGTYGLTVTTTCGTDSTTIRVEERETETLQAETIDLFACLGDSLPFTAEPEADVSYRWLDGPTGASRTFRESGTYELVRTNPCSEATTTVGVTFQDCCQLYVPSAFSPNGDGINDIFRAFPDTDKCGLVSDFSLQVFDRWGGEVYAGSDLTDGWDGKVKDEALGNGHFVYSISYFNGLETVRRSGGVVVLR